jgi:hypothetical protein
MELLRYVAYRKRATPATLLAWSTVLPANFLIDLRAAGQIEAAY